MRSPVPDADVGVNRVADDGTHFVSDLDTLRTERWLAERLGVSAATLKMWRRVGQGPRFVKAGHAVRYAQADVAAWLRDRTVGGAS